MAACELCTPNEVLLENELAYARPDNNALSPGHVLVIPKRHVAGFFDMTAEEQSAVLALLDQAQRLVHKRHAPDGYNIGSTSEKLRGSRACTSTCISSHATPAMYRTRAAA